MLESAEADGFPAFLLTYGKSRGKESRSDSQRTRLSKGESASL